VEWDAEDEQHEGVFIPRRDTSSRLQALAGGRVFPGVHYHSPFQVTERGDAFAVAMTNPKDGTDVSVHARLSEHLPRTSVFESLEEASEFFQRGSLSYSVTNCHGCFEGLELRTEGWRMEPLRVDHVESSYFANVDLFPRGSVEFDSAFLMRGIPHEWHSRETLNSCKQELCTIPL